MSKLIIYLGRKQNKKERHYESSKPAHSYVSRKRKIGDDSGSAVAVREMTPPLTRRANRGRPRQTAPGSPRPETRPSSARRCEQTPKRPHVRARVREPGVRPQLDLGPHELHPASGRLPHPDRMR